MRKIAIVAAAAIVSLVAVAVASAGQNTRETLTFSDPISGTFDCGAFTATLSGHENSRLTTWFHANGEPLKQVGRIQAIETAVNESTSKSIDVRTSLTVHVDFVAGTTTFTGVRNLSTVPG